MPAEVDGVQVLLPDRLVELERAAKSRMLTPDEMSEMRDLGAGVRSQVDQAKARLQEVDDGTER